jgi:hypothetical protein
MTFIFIESFLGAGVLDRVSPLVKQGACHLFAAAQYQGFRKGNLRDQPGTAVPTNAAIERGSIVLFTDKFKDFSIRGLGLTALGS